jgi:hypothetical protein
MTSTMDVGSGQPSLSVVKVTGRRIGDGDCIGGRAYSAKGRVDSEKKEGRDAASGGNKILKDPVKGIRNLFGF